MLSDGEGGCVTGLIGLDCGLVADDISQHGIIWVRCWRVGKGDLPLRFWTNWLRVIGPLSDYKGPCGVASTARDIGDSRLRETDREDIRSVESCSNFGSIHFESEEIKQHGSRSY